MEKSKNVVMLRQMKVFSQKITHLRNARLNLLAAVDTSAHNAPYVIKCGNSESFLSDSIKQMVGKSIEVENYLKVSVRTLCRFIDDFPKEAIPVDFISTSEWREKKLYLQSTVSDKYCFEMDLVYGKIVIKEMPLP